MKEVDRVRYSPMLRPPAAANLPLRMAAVLLSGLVMPGCSREPAAGPRTPDTAAVTQPPAVGTPAAVLERITALGGTYQLDAAGRVWALDLRRRPLRDGDLGVLRSLPEVLTMTLRGVNRVGGTLSADGLAPIASLRKLRRLDLSANVSFGSLAPVASLPELEFLDLTGTTVDDEAIGSLARVGTLKELRLGWRTLPLETLRAVCRLPLEKIELNWRSTDDAAILGGFKRLRHWPVGFGSVPVTALPSFAGVDRLENFSIRCTEGKCPPVAVAALRTMRSLRKLEISGGEDADWTILSALEALPNLEELTLGGVPAAELSRMPATTAQSLDLLYSFVGGDEMAALARWPALRRVLLDPRRTTPGGLEGLAGCRTLESLIFVVPMRVRPGQFAAEREPGANGFRAADLRPVLRSVPLKTLDVSNLGFGHELVTELSAAERLEDLRIVNCPIGDESFLQLAELPNLRSIDILGTPVTTEAAQALYDRKQRRCTITDNWCCGCLAFLPVPEEGPRAVGSP